MATKTFSTAIVVGASSGIGAAIATELAVTKGTRVALLARRSDQLDAVVASIRAAGGDAFAVVHDVTDYDAVPALFDELVGRLGGLDLMVYAAGVMTAVAEHEYDFTKDRFMVEVNLLGTMAWCNPTAAYFEGRRAGTLVGVSSIAGERGRRDNPAYCTSKGAMTIYLESLRNRTSRYGVDVVTVKPGFVSTAMTEGREDLLWIVEPSQIARDTVQLAAAGGSPEVFLPRRWGAALAVIRNIPSPIFRHLNI